MWIIDTLKDLMSKILIKVKNYANELQGLAIECNKIRFIISKRTLQRKTSFSVLLNTAQGFLFFFFSFFAN